ncbi:hypothetical protein VT84_35420 [Gemmata sp. SH-PL17]|uniref:hypothetical protein n=1 Tax=Gemmata sp. SH-PL17 TaxID=1630693 RepID=UPI00078D48C2|nr:hypothetical protein [Gemmata sp. SH-PL17]AMV29737.1 hypothetical protein VT84_35420 [Gemmata sp. SH-PL17]
MKLSIRVALLAPLLALLAGCGASDKRATVSGKVTVAGKAGLPGGIIRFVSAENPSRIGGGTIKPDGTYEVTDAPVGECKVIIDNSHLDPSANKSNAPGMPGTGSGMPGMKGMPGGKQFGPGAGGPKDADKEKMTGAPKGAEVPSEMGMGKTDHAGEKYVRIDGAYFKLDTTTLKATVSDSGSNALNFEVK